MRIVDDLLARIEAAAGPLAERHAAEIAELDERIARYGERGSGKKTLDEQATSASCAATAPTSCWPGSP